MYEIVKNSVNYLGASINIDSIEFCQRQQSVRNSNEPPAIEAQFYPRQDQDQEKVNCFD